MNRWKSRNAKIESVKKDIRQNMNWLQEQQATLKQQVSSPRHILCAHVTHEYVVCR